MKSIKIYTSQENQYTCVPNIFIDKYMHSANGEFVKIYLYLLRALTRGNCDFSISHIADMLDMTENDVKRAISYWDKKNLLSIDCDSDGSITCIEIVSPDRLSFELPASSESSMGFSDTSISAMHAPTMNNSTINGSGTNASDKNASNANASNIDTSDISTSDMNASNVDAANTNTSNTNKSDISISGTGVSGTNHSNINISNADISNANNLAASMSASPDFARVADFKETDDGSEILCISERYMGHPLGLNEINTIYSWYDQLHFSADLIEYLVEYCVEKSHNNIYYMNKVALNWLEEGITTSEQARQQVNIHSQSHYSVMKAMGISGRNLVKSEVAYIDKWLNKYGFSLDIINEACARAVKHTGKSSFEYADTILEKWHGNGIKHLEDIAKLDVVHEQNAAAKRTAARNHDNRSASNRFNNFTQREYSDEFYDDLERRLRTKN